MNFSILSLLLMACVISGNYAAKIPSVVHNLDQITSQLQDQPSSIDHNLTENDQIDQDKNSFDHLQLNYDQLMMVDFVFVK